MSGTVWGNQIDGAHSGGTPIELGNHAGPFNVTVAQNVVSNHEWGMMFSHTAGMTVLNNKFTNVDNPFSDDGGYDKTEWIGTNTVDGVKQVGWPGHRYGAEPTTFSPSTAPSGTKSAVAAVSNDAQQQKSPALAAATSSSVDATDASPSAAAATVKPSAAPIQQNTLLGKLGTTADFKNAASTSQSSSGGASDTQGRNGAGILTPPTGGSLKADLTNIGSLDRALSGAASHAGSGSQTHSVSGIGAALSNWDQGGRHHDVMNADTWRHA
jgi:hypothetical protein